MKQLQFAEVKKCCERLGLIVLDADDLGNGVLGRFFPPNIILVNIKLCSDQRLEQQKPVLVLLHEICHYFKHQEHPNDYSIHDEEACFEFEVICDQVLNFDEDIAKDFEAVKRLGLEKPMDFLQHVISNGS